MADRLAIEVGAAPSFGGGPARAGSPDRYRHPGDVVHFVFATVAFVLVLLAVVIASDDLLGTSAATPTPVVSSTTAGRTMVGIAQLVFVALVIVTVIEIARVANFVVLGLAAGAAFAAALLTVAIDTVLVGDGPSRLSDNVAANGWLAHASFPQPALLAAAVALLAFSHAWLPKTWRHLAWAGLVAVGALRALAGVVLPMELVVAAASGAVAGVGALVAFGGPDLRAGAATVLDALVGAGVPATEVEPAAVEAKGSRPFVALTADGTSMFVKVLGRDERSADLLYRMYRFVRLQRVGDVRPAASLKQAVEHQAVVGMLAERAGVRAPHVDRVATGPDGSALLVMDRVAGRPLADLSAEEVSDDVLRRLWQEAARLHDHGIAHRSLRTGNVMVDIDDRPWVVDFSFSELGATSRQCDLDVAELLVSLAVIVGPERAVDSAIDVLGTDVVLAAVPLLQPLALSAATRRAARPGGLVTHTREAALAAVGAPPVELEKLQRVKPKLLLMIAVGAGAFYFLLPQLAQVGNSWRAFKSADWSWVALVLVLSVFTYIGAAWGVMGSVVQRLRFGPTLMIQTASSFVNRVSPANVGGMALNVRFLQKTGVESPTAVSAVGLNSVVGGLVHVVLLVVFFTWTGSALGRAFSLPSSSVLLAAIAVVGALVGVVMATRWGRRIVWKRVRHGTRSAVANLREVAADPWRMVLLFGGSFVVTLAYIGALAASAEAFGGGTAIARIGAVYLGASALASASPTPGNLGALEAALVAGLTGVGMESGVAVSTVLTYRLATYWLPIAPGWLAWHLVQRWEYV